MWPKLWLGWVAGCPGEGDGPVRFTAAVTREGDWYVARCLEVEVASQGRTLEEALANLKEALELYFEDTPIPDVTPPLIAPVEVELPAGTRRA